MDKPLATLGDAWRAQLRANDVPRRPPPSSERAARPDRGHVEQPGERSPPAMVRRRVETPAATRPVALVRQLAPEIRHDLHGRGELILPGMQLRPVEPPPPPSAPSPPAAEQTEMPAKKRTVRRHPDETREKAIALFHQLTEEFRKRGVTGRNTGATELVAKKLGIGAATISNWVQRDLARREGLAQSQPTLVSSPQSGPVSVKGPLPPVPVVVGLEEYIKAVVAREVAAEVKRLMRGLGD